MVSVKRPFSNQLRRKRNLDYIFHSFLMLRPPRTITSGMSHPLTLIITAGVIWTMLMLARCLQNTYIHNLTKIPWKTTILLHFVICKTGIKMSTCLPIFKIQWRKKTVPILKRATTKGVEKVPTEILSLWWKFCWTERLTLTYIGVHLKYSSGAAGQTPQLNSILCFFLYVYDARR